MKTVFNMKNTKISSDLVRSNGYHEKYHIDNWSHVFIDIHNKIYVQILQCEV